MKTLKLVLTAAVICVVCLAAQAQYTYTDNFDDGNANGWFGVPSPNWVSGAFVSLVNDWGLWLYPGGPIIGDFTFQADVTILQRYNDPGGADHIALTVNVPWDPATCQLTSNHYYMFTTRQGSINDVYLYDADNGHCNGQTGYTLNPIMGTHTYKITKTGTTYHCYIDNVNVITWSDASAYTGGYIGIYGGQGYTGSGTPPSMRFDNIIFTNGANTYTENFTADANGWITCPTQDVLMPGGSPVSRVNEFTIWKYPCGPITGDFDFEADATILQRFNDPAGADHIALAVNVPWNTVTQQLNNNNYYMFFTRQGSLFQDTYLYDAQTGVFLRSNGYTLNPIMGTHHFKITRSGNTYNCYIDGQNPFPYWTGSSPYSGGYVALYSGQGYTGTGTPPSIKWDNITFVTVPAPTNFVSTVILPDTIATTWSYAADPDHFRFERSFNGGPWVFNGDAPGNFRQSEDFSLQPGTYQYRIRAESDTMNSDWIMSNIDTIPPIPNPPVRITLTPLTTPIIIPSTGGSFSFSITIINDASTQQFMVWAKQKLPNGTWSNPVLGPVIINPPIGWTIGRLRTQNVPASAPSGLYYYMGYVGLYESVKWDSSYFTYTKLPSGGNGPIIANWDNTGEPFPGEVMMSSVSQPSQFALQGASPNPFNPTTVISYQLPQAGQVVLQVYDTAGRFVTTMVNGWREAGPNQAVFDGTDLASGIYFYRLSAGLNLATGKMVLMK